MQEATRSASPSHDFDKHGQDHLEMVATRTPPGEPEKQQLAPVMSRGPEVHEKVSANALHFSFSSDHGISR
jgi:hypothetical protein